MIEDDIYPYIVKSDSLKYVYSGKNIKLNINGFEDWYKNKIATKSNTGIKYQKTNKNIFEENRDWERRFTIGSNSGNGIVFGINKDSCDRYFSGSLKVDNYFYPMTIGVINKGDYIYVSFDEYKLNINYLFKNGQIICFDRFTTQKIRQGMLSKTYVEHHNSREKFFVSGQHGFDVEYQSDDNSETPTKYIHTEYKTNIELTKELTKDAYLFYYLATQVLKDQGSKCIGHNAGIKGN
jgi:hypothetical protein